MGSGYHVDIDALHDLLWLQADSRGALRIVQTDWCHTIRVNRFTLCRLLSRMEEEGRLVCLTRSAGSAPKTYRVVEPAEWASRLAHAVEQ